MDRRWVGSLVRVGLVALAITIQSATLGAADPLAEATALNQQALTLYQQGRYAEAEPLYKRSLAIREKGLGPDHPDTATVRGNLAALLDRNR